MQVNLIFFLNDCNKNCFCICAIPLLTIEYDYVLYDVEMNLCCVNVNDSVYCPLIKYVTLVNSDIDNNSRHRTIVFCVFKYKIHLQ